MLKKLFFTLLMIGCVKTPLSPSVPNMHDMSNYAGAEYASANSICIDGLLVNLGNECKTLVEIQGIGAIKAIQCHEAKKKNSPWDKYTFYVISSHSIAPPPHTMEFCVDPTAIIYIRERPL